MNPKVNGGIKLLQISLLAFYRNTERDTRHLKQASNFHREHYPGNTALALKIPYKSSKQKNNSLTQPFLSITQRVCW